MRHNQHRRAAIDAELHPHNDSPDIVELLCVRKAGELAAEFADRYNTGHLQGVAAG